MNDLSEINFDDFFEPEEGKLSKNSKIIFIKFKKFPDNEEDFNFIDPSILQQFSRTSISIEKIQKEIFNLEEKGDDDFRSEKAMRNFEFQIQVNRVLQIFDEMIKKIETLLCVQEFVKDQELMQKYFNESDMEDLSRYCSRYSADIDLDDDKEAENVSRLIQALLSTDLHKYSENYVDIVSILLYLMESSEYEFYT